MQQLDNYLALNIHCKSDLNNVFFRFVKKHKGHETLLLLKLKIGYIIMNYYAAILVDSSLDQFTISPNHAKYE